MRTIQITDWWSIVYRASTVMVLSVSGLCVAAFAFQIVVVHWVQSWSTQELNERPIVGILAEEDEVGSYIAASYVKAAESAGTRVVPIFIGQPVSYYEKIVNSVNGIVFPGGSADLWAKGGYGEAAYTLYQLVVEANRKGVHFPLFAVCLGFEALPVISKGMSKDVLENINGTEDIPLPLNFTVDINSSHLFAHASPVILDILRTRNVTANHHSQCFTESSLAKNNLTDTWRVLTTSQIEGGKVFISTMEHITYPQIFGTQFHPEKIAFEWNPASSDPHWYEALLANRWFYDYFAHHARLNRNKFPSEVEEKASLIYNFDPEFSDGYFEQIYRF